MTLVNCTLLVCRKVLEAANTKLVRHLGAMVLWYGVFISNDDTAGQSVALIIDFQTLLNN